MSILLDWVWSLLYKLGLFKKEATILLLGLDNAGKTTLLHKLKYGSLRLFIPTQRAHLEEITIGNVKFRAWDLGGHEQVRHLWKDYYAETNAIVFVVDSADRMRLQEAKEELHALLNEEALADCVLVILANKTDLKGSLSREELIEVLDLKDIDLGNDNAERIVQLFRCSLVEGVGFIDAFKWLAARI